MPRKTVSKKTAKKPQTVARARVKLQLWLAFIIIAATILVAVVTGWLVWRAQYGNDAGRGIEPAMYNVQNPSSF